MVVLRGVEAPAPEGVIGAFAECAGRRGVKSPFFFLLFGDFFDFPSRDLSSGVFGLVPAFDDGLLVCLILFLDFIVSVFKEMGLGRPCNLRKRPQALHNTSPVSSRRHKGVVCVLQFLHTGLEILVLLVVVPLLVYEVVFAFGWIGSDDVGVSERGGGAAVACGAVSFIES